MKIQNKVARYINNVTATNTSVQLNKMVKAIALAERELEQARQMLADFTSAPVPPAPKKSVVHSGMGQMTVASEVRALVMDTDKSVVVTTKPEYKGLDLSAPANVDPEPEYKGLDLTPAPEPTPEPEPEYKGLDLSTPLVQEVKQQMPKPKPAPAVNNHVGFLSGPMKASTVLNGARPSHKHGTLEYMEKLKKFMFSGIMKLAEAGVREIRVGEFDNVELLVSLVWGSVLAKCPDMKLVVYTNDKGSFEQYKVDEYEAKFNIESPYRLQQRLRQVASKVIRVEGNAYAVRRAVARDAVGYVRINPFGMEDVTTPLFQGKRLQVDIHPWTLAVEVGGDLPALSLKGDGGDYRPRKMVADEKLSASEDTSDYKGLTLS